MVASPEDGVPEPPEEPINHMADLAAKRPRLSAKPAVNAGTVAKTLALNPGWDNSPGAAPRRQREPWRSRRQPYPDAPPRTLPGQTLRFWAAEEGLFAAAEDPALAGAHAPSAGTVRLGLGLGLLTTCPPASVAAPAPGGHRQAKERTDWPPVDVRLRQPADGVYAELPAFAVRSTMVGSTDVENIEGYGAELPSKSPHGAPPSQQGAAGANARAAGNPNPNPSVLKGTPRPAVARRQRQRRDLRGRPVVVAPALPGAYFPDAAPAVANSAYLAANADAPLRPIRTAYLSR